MTRDEHLMVIGMEECNEIAQRLSKALRFGLSEVQPNQDMSNSDRIQQEYSDLAAVLEMLGIGAPLGRWMDEKRAKVEQFLKYSAECGTVEADAGPARPGDDVTCEHGTAMDVHCCHCHSGFIFDRHHECLPARPGDGERPSPPVKVVLAARSAAAESPCRSKRGAVVFVSEIVIARSHNRKPDGFACDGSAECKADCRVTAVHAEQGSLLRAGLYAKGADLLHVKVADGALVASGGPSCVQCSKLALAAGIDGVWLFHEDGWRRYGAAEFHQLSLEAQKPSVSPGPLTIPRADAERELQAAIEHINIDFDHISDAEAVVRIVRAAHRLLKLKDHP